MQIVTIATLKGGTGKTMTAGNIAGILAEDKRILVIDMDPQGNITSNLGVDISDEDRLSTRDIMELHPPAPEDVVLKAPVEELPNLDLIPSSIWLFETEMGIHTRTNWTSILQRYIDRHAGYFEDYDYILIDTNPSMGPISQNAYLVSDSIILVADISSNAIQGAEVFMYLWDTKREDLGMEDNIKAIVINNADRRLNLTGELESHCKDKEAFAGLLTDTVIPSRAKMKDTEVYMKPINILYPKSEECAIMRKVVEELKDKEAL